MIEYRNLFLMQGQLLILSLVGLFMTKKGMLDSAFQKSATNLLINIVLPCNIIVSFEMELSKQLMIECFAIFLLSCIVQVGCSLLNIIFYMKSDSERLPVLKFGTISSNAGFLGSSVVEGLFGGNGMLLASIFLIPQRIAIWTTGVSFFSSEKGKFPVKKMLTHPCIIAVWVGMIIALTQYTPPEFINLPMKKLSACTLPLSMILVGMILSDVHIRDFLDRDVLYFCFIRLVFIPFLVWIGCRIARLDELTLAVGTILSAMPMGSTGAILAVNYHRGEEFAVSCVALSSLLSLVSIPVWCLLF